MEKHEHHNDAAHHFQLAAVQHQKAHELIIAGDHDKSAHHAHIAHGHHTQAGFHTTEAARIYSEQHS